MYGHGKDDALPAGSYLRELREIASTYCTGTGNILEWGSGISTLMLADFLEEKGMGTLVTLDDNLGYLKAVCSALETSRRVQALFLDTVGPQESQADEGLNYSTVPLSLRREYDLIFIDGRRRVECALVSAMLSGEKTIVVIHDYRRARYQPVQMLFDIVADSLQYRCLRVKPSIRSVFQAAMPQLETAMNLGHGLNLRTKSGRLCGVEVKSVA